MSRYDDGPSYSRRRDSRSDYKQRSMMERDEDSEDDEEERYSKKRRVEGKNIEDRLANLIYRVGEKSTSSLESNLEGLAAVLQGDISNYKHKILKILCDCVLEMPERLTIYTTLVGLLNCKNFHFGGLFLETLMYNLNESLKDSEFEKARIMIRFLSDLVNCRVVTASSLLDLFDDLVEAAHEDGVPQVRTDWCVYAVLSSLPWVGRDLYDKKPSNLSKLVKSIESYMAKRQRVHVGMLRVWSSDEPNKQEEYLDCLWAQIRQLSTNKWTEMSISRPYLSFRNLLEDALQHSLSQVNLPPHDPEFRYPLPTVVFRMFDYTDVPEGPPLPGAHAIERFLIEEVLRQVIMAEHRDRKECAKALMGASIKAKVPLEYMIVEVIFGEMLRVPRPQLLDLFYGVLLIDLCRLQPEFVPQILAQAVELLYERLDSMTAPCVQRLASWFGYHLSNFQFRWTWDDWSDCLVGDSDSNKAVFVREVLQYCMRLSYHERIERFMPDNFQILLPTKPTCFFKYEQPNSASLPGTTTAHSLITEIRARCTPEECQATIKDVPNPLSEDDGEEPLYNPLKIDVFFSVILHLGRKSFTHTFAHLGRYVEVLKMLCKKKEAQVHLLRVLYEVWSTHQQMMIVIVDKLLKIQVVECAAVANWLFSPEMNASLTQSYVWDILHSTVSKMNKQTMRLEKDYENARELYESASRSMNDDGDLRIKESKLEKARNEQKNLFLIIFQSFILNLSERLSRGHSESNAFWCRSVLERLQQTFVIHYEQVRQYGEPLENLLFTNDIDPRILLPFQQFCALTT